MWRSGHYPIRTLVEQNVPSPHPYLYFTFRSLSLYASLEGLKKALRRTEVSFGFRQILLKSPKGISIAYYSVSVAHGSELPLTIVSEHAWYFLNYNYRRPV